MGCGTQNEHYDSRSKLSQVIKQLPFNLSKANYENRVPSCIKIRAAQCRQTNRDAVLMRATTPELTSKVHKKIYPKPFLSTSQDQQCRRDKASLLQVFQGNISHDLFVFLRREFLMAGTLVLLCPETAALFSTSTGPYFVSGV